MISEDKTNIIKHYCKSILYHNEELWMKKGVSGNFDNPMGSFNRAKFSELWGDYCYITLIASLTPVTMGFIETMD